MKGNAYDGGEGNEDWRRNETKEAKMNINWKEWVKVKKVERIQWSRMTNKYYSETQKQCEMLDKEDQSCDKIISFLTVYKKFTHH